MNRAARNRRMVRDHSAGKTVTEIARMYGLSLNWTGELLRQHGANMPTSGRGIRCDLDIDEVVCQYESGSTIREVAGLYDVSYGKVYRLLAAVGVTFRPRGG
ncbi:helix-turn-helix domain-containing protein [Amycolatopsis sp. RTGN1]|uniref:helix-turn-helix domain-containing protein n=1 Tax=Amycolatopsis ponsaeliensis TaxID=2992142 RepID=UPI00254B9810|nr:helix-turn-helix domain-containing protein [Amycolatopsis sp. RTGN1]